MYVCIGYMCCSVLEAVFVVFLIGTDEEGVAPVSHLHLYFE